MNFRFTNLLGAPYRGGNILLSKGDSLLAPVGNRVNEVKEEVEREKTSELSRRRKGACSTNAERGWSFFCSFSAPDLFADAGGERSSVHLRMQSGRDKERRRSQRAGEADAGGMLATASSTKHPMFRSQLSSLSLSTKNIQTKTHQFDLISSSVSTLPFENREQVRK